MKTPPLPLSQGGARTTDDEAVARLLADLPPLTPNDLAVHRVWRRLESGPARPTRPSLAWWALIGAATVALVVLVVTGPRPVRSLHSELAAASGGVFSTHGTEDWSSGVPGQTLAEDEHVRTNETGHAVLRVPGVASMFLASDSEVTLERLSQGALLHLTRGSLTSRVSKRGPGEPFIVQAGLYSVRVVGTLFTVDREPTGRIFVSVREGTVEVSDDAAQVVRVTAGTTWSSDDPGKRGTDHTSDGVRALLEDSLSGRSRLDLVPLLTEALRAAPPVPAPPPGVAPAAAPDRAGSVKAVDAAQPPADRPLFRHLSVPVAVHSSSVGPESIASGTPDQPKPAPAKTPEPAPVPTPRIEPPPDPTSHAAAALAAAAEPILVSDGPYQQAHELERKGDFRGAADQLQLASEEGSPHAELALYELGRIQKQRLGDSSRALDSFRRYRSTYTTGTLLAEVDLSILEITAGGKHPTPEALDEATHFLKAHPDSDRADEVRLLRGNLLRDRGDYARAEADYAAISDPRRQDEARYLTAYCQQKLGDRTGAIATLKAYLAQFPQGTHRAEALRALGGGD